MVDSAVDSVVRAQLTDLQGQLDRRIETERREIHKTEDTLNQRIDLAVEAAKERWVATQEKITLLDQMHQQRWQCSEEAIRKSEAATEKRFDGVNQFRAQLADQNATFARTEVMDAKFTSMDQRIGKNENILSNIQGRSAILMGTIALISGVLGAVISHAFG